MIWFNCIRFSHSAAVCKVCSRSLQNVSTADSLHIKSVADGLYKIGDTRFHDNKTSENVYKHFAEPIKLLRINEEDYKDYI